MTPLTPGFMMQELCTSAAQKLADDLEGRGFDYAVFMVVVDPSDPLREAVMAAEVIKLPRSAVQATQEFLRFLDNHLEVF